MKKSISTTFSLLSLYQRLVALSMFAFLLLSLFFYGYFLQVAIGYTVERSATTRFIEDVKSEITELEEEYSHREELMTMEHAKSLGFHEVSHPQYITISSNNATVGLRN